ncbi:MAG: hypothetical protein GTN64_08675 [Candidatus Latescibacteria bacterium]|nr:hypothetical protein [Candidatus Latescibacterota bacterium]NIO78673.1 hypothetical protein [Candidatus Latescibacterota bacterium]
MTEQPEAQVEEVEEVQEPTQQPQEREGGMRFFVRVQDNPDLDGYMEPRSLHRFEDRPDQIIMERFDKEKRIWVDNPNMIAFLGIGGADDYEEIDEDKANQLIAQWTPQEEAEEAGAEPEPETEGEEVETEPEEGGSSPISDEEYVAEAGFRDQKGDDHSTGVFDYLMDVIEGEDEEEVEEEEDEVEERSFSVMGLLRRIFNVSD